MPWTESARWGPPLVRVLEWIVPVDDRPRDAYWWRSRMLATALLISAIFGGITIIPNVIAAAMGRQYAVLVVDGLAYAALIAALLARRASVEARTATLLALSYGLGLYFTVTYGVSAAGPLWLLATPMLAAVLLGTRAGVLAIGGLALTYLGLGVGVYTGAIRWLIPLPAESATAGNFLSWVVVASNSMLIALLTSMAASLVSDGLDREIVARRMAEEERTRLGRALEQSRDAVLLLDTDGIVRRSNAAANALCAPQDVLGGSIELLDLRTGNSDAAETADPLPWRAALAGESWFGRCTLSAEAGVRMLDGSMSCVRDDDGRVTHLLIVLRDVTREHGLEDRLRQSAKLEAVGTLVGGIAHDFNNLLQPILANAELLKQHRTLDPDLRRLVDDIVTGAERGRNLVRRVLTFTRGATLDRQPVRLVDIVEETARLLTRTLPPSVRVSLEADPNLWVLADPAELHHALVNLATNAAHAMPSGGALSIRATAARVTEAEHLLTSAFPVGSQVAHLAVQDTGTGMHARTLARIFEPFFTTKPPGQGTGLGLASVHGTVTDLGGIVVPESAVGVGTTMHLYLPTIPAPALAASAATDAEPDAEPALPLRRVLAVDDERVVLETVVRMLQRGGCHVTSCGDPRDAARLVREATEPFDCVVTDLTMPYLDGIEVARAIADEAPTLPIVLVSGFIDDADQAHADEAGIRVILPKPYSRTQLLDAVESAIVGTGALRRTPRGTPVIPAT
jgi:signal transduction histidine kinase/ActR/RegA family two-component response regulator